jgi:hypothetical protein
MARAVTALPAEVAALFAKVRARLRRLGLMRMIGRVAWLTLIIEAVAVATHLQVTTLSPLLVPLIVLAAAALAAAASVLNRPRAEDCARFADLELGGHSAFGATLEASAGRLTGSPAALEWLTARTRGSAAVALTSLARAPQVPWPTAALVAAGSGALALALILSLPGGSRESGERVGLRPQGATRAPEVQPPHAQSVAAPGAQIPAAAERLSAATRSQTAPALATSNESTSAAGGAQSSGAGAAGGQEAGSSADDSAHQAMSRILELAAHRRALETGGVRVGGAGLAVYGAESVGTAANAGSVAAPAARPSARGRPELTGPVQSRLLARYAQLREATP